LTEGVVDGTPGAGLYPGKSVWNSGRHSSPAKHRDPAEDKSIMFRAF